jgi:DNA-binding NarL/FixJ family response regulator
LERSIIRILIVDDYEPWRRFVRLTLLVHDRLEVVGEAGDGAEAVTRAQQLQPDLILLDIGLPNLNGIEAARKIRVSAPWSKILFVSENRAGEVAAEALKTGGSGYVVKSDAAKELLPAIKAVLAGRQFVSAGLAGHKLAAPRHEPAHDQRPNGNRHQLNCYPDDRAFVDGFARFIATTLRNGDAVVVVATASHRARILEKLTGAGVDVDAAVEEKRYVPLDVPDSSPGFRVVEHLTAETVRDATERNLHVGLG